MMSFRYTYKCVLQNIVNNKLYENHLTVKVVVMISCLFDMLDNHKNHRQHQAYRSTTSVCNGKNYITKTKIISFQIIFLLTSIA